MATAYKVGFGVLCVLALLCALIAACVAHRTLLVAQGEIVVDHYPVPDRNRFPAVARIANGERVPVLGCDELKSDRGVHIRLKNGEEGYVMQGKYYLERSSIWSKAASPITFCPSEWP
ncbi:MAG: hypothetical protein ABSH33_09800 [Steroidobacteraceae bacterium]|jgi:hypothetical protein